MLLAAQAGADPEIAEVLHRLNVSVADGLADLLRGMRQRGLLDSSRDIDVEIRRLHALIDGLALQCMTDPVLRSETDVRAMMRAEVAALSEPCGARVG
jgi:BetI-type transcriptional repressor, C-terminal